MKLVINAILEGQEIMTDFLKKLQENNITPKENSVKMEAYSSKKGEWVSVENIRLVYNQE